MNPKHEAEKTKVVVLGGGFAGILAARRVARGSRGKAEVTLVTAADAFVERVRFHELAAGRALPRLLLAPLLARAGVTTLHATARAVDPTARRLVCARPDGTEVIVPYDVLVYALGSTIDLAVVPGAAAHAHSVASE